MNPDEIRRVGWGFSSVPAVGAAAVWPGVKVFAVCAPAGGGGGLYGPGPSGYYNWRSPHECAPVSLRSVSRS